MQTRRVVLFKAALWALAGLGAGVALYRFAAGLGASTALGDSTPWGLWIGFDVMGGVALAAGGFVIAAVTHIFGRERYLPAARPAILTAFLGYGAVVVGLLFDLGLPWNIWHPVIFWNLRSPLFEVAWCVMLYFAVLGLEVTPVLLERTRLQRLRQLLLRLSLPIMILGIMLSTLHQSSLGSLLLIMPFRVHPLWYTPRLPELFFVSAICLGLAMVMVESCLTAWLYRKEPERDMLAGLARMAAWALAAYLVIRLADLWAQGKLGLLAAPTWERNLFLVEMLLSTVIPAALFFVPAVRRSFPWVWLGASAAVLGFVLDRINASGLSQVWVTRFFYFPAWTEFAVSLGIVAACGLIFCFIQEHFPVDRVTLARAERDRAARAQGLPQFPALTQVWLGEGWRKAARVYSMIFVAAMAVSLVGAPTGEPVVDISTQRARGADVLRVGRGPVYVYFEHARHQKDLGGPTSCARCHHLHKVGDVGTPCSECHRALDTPTLVFDHTAHVHWVTERPSCPKCHGQDQAQITSTVVTCQDCHRKDMMAPNPIVTSFTKLVAGGYQDAMHRMCIPCHAEKAKDPSIKRPQLGYCGTCHNEGTRAERLYRERVPGSASRAGDG
jgi:Ni/Fe-hydrogenase subunit HybB-like protein